MTWQTESWYIIASSALLSCPCTFQSSLESMIVSLHLGLDTMLSCVDQIWVTPYFQYHSSASYLHFQIFSKYGQVMKIVTFNKNSKLLSYS